MSLTSVVVAVIVLCDGYTQESGACPARHVRAARAPRPAGSRPAAGRRAAAGLAGRAAPQLREGGMQVHARRAARAVCVSAGRRPSGVCARGAGRGSPLAVEISRRLREVLGEISAINLELLARRELE